MPETSLPYDEISFHKGRRAAQVLTIAGSDSGGGAGIQADIRTISHLGAHPLSAITAITAQNTVGISAVEMVSAAMLSAQITAIREDFTIDAVKIGVIGSLENLSVLIDIVPTLGAKWVIFDPVLGSTSGHALASRAMVEKLPKLIEYVDLITPNLPEFERLGGMSAARDWGAAVLVKGGHGEGDILTDRLWKGPDLLGEWSARRQKAKGSHGTGCTMASAIATYAGQGYTLIDAVQAGHIYVQRALAAAPDIGKGNGPLGRPEL